MQVIPGAVFHAIWHIKKRLFGPGGVANPHDTTRYRRGLCLARTKTPLFYGCQQAQNTALLIRRELFVNPARTELVKALRQTQDERYRISGINRAGSTGGCRTFSLPGLIHQQIRSATSQKSICKWRLFEAIPLTGVHEDLPLKQELVALYCANLFHKSA
jgi:hypothetical protein